MTTQHRIVTAAGRPCIDTGKLVIGIAHVPGPIKQFSRDQERLQAALLEPKTAIPATALHRLAGAVWQWL